MIYRLGIRLLVRPFLWAVQRPTQNALTRAIKKAWRAL